MSRETPEQRRARYLRQKERLGGVAPTTLRRQQRRERRVREPWQRYGYSSERTMQRRRAEGRPLPADTGAAWRIGVKGQPVIMWRPDDPVSRRAARRAIERYKARRV